MASPSPDITLASIKMVDEVNGLFTYDVTIPDGRVFQTGFGPWPLVRAQQATSLLRQHIQPDGSRA